MLNHYRQLFSQMEGHPLLQKISLVLVSSTFVDWALLPLVTKLEGIFLPVFMISLFMLLGNADGFLQPLFHHARLSHIFLFSIFLDLIQLLSYWIYFIDPYYFIYTILIIFTIQSITFEVSRIHTTDFLKDELELKDYLMLRSFLLSVGTISGTLFTLIYDLFFHTFDYLFILLAVLTVSSMWKQWQLYLFFKRNNSPEPVIYAGKRKSVL